MDELSINATVEVALDNDDVGDSFVEAVEAAETELEVEYEVYAAECKAAMRLALARIKNLSEAIDRAGMRNPFDRIESRIKTFKSVKGKCRARGYEVDILDIREKVRDVAGIRIITKYIDEVIKVKDMIKQIPDIVTDSIKDYVATPKDNGYRSIHLGCRVNIYDPFNGTKSVPIEIQIRSRSMDLWATLEHDLKYKNPNPSPDVSEKFIKISKILEDFDEEAIRLRDYDNVSEANEESMASLNVLNDLGVLI